MTLIYSVSFECSICGASSQHGQIFSTNEMGSPDLDFRPSEYARSTISEWVQRCPECGYCSSNISKTLEKAKEIIQTPDYKKQLSDKNYPELANFFLCKAMIDDAHNMKVEATWSLIHAAWVCDDADNQPNAVNCRNKAALMLREVIELGEHLSKEEGINTVILVDLLRRSGQFEEARSEIKKNIALVDNDNYNKILEFQLILIQISDLNCYNIDDIYRPHSGNYLDKLIKAGLDSKLKQILLEEIEGLKNEIDRIDNQIYYKTNQIINLYEEKREIKQKLLDLIAMEKEGINPEKRQELENELKRRGIQKLNEYLSDLRDYFDELE